MIFKNLKKINWKIKHVYTHLQIPSRNITHISNKCSTLAAAPLLLNWQRLLSLQEKTSAAAAAAIAYITQMIWQTLQMPGEIWMTIWDELKKEKKIPLREISNAKSQGKLKGQVKSIAIVNACAWQRFRKQWWFTKKGREKNKKSKMFVCEC